MFSKKVTGIASRFQKYYSLELPLILGSDPLLPEYLVCDIYN